MNEYNKYNAACPDDSELVAYKEGSLPAEDKQLLTEHLLLCSHCLLQMELLPWNTVEEMQRAMLEDNTEVEKETEISPILERAFDIYRKKQAAKPKNNSQSLEEVLAGDGLEVGQIWRTKLEQIAVPLSDGEERLSVSEFGSVPHLVVITNISVETRQFLSKKYHVIKVIPVDDNVHYARENDIVFREDENPLNYPLMLSTWNQQEMLRENLNRCLGRLDVSPNSFKTLPNANGQDFLSFLFNKGFEAISNTAYALLSVVEKGLYSDEAMRHRAREFENTVYLRAPVRELRESLTLAYEQAVSKSSRLDKYKEFIVSLFPRVENSQETQLEAAESEVASSKNIKAFFNGKLTGEVIEIDETGTEKELIFHSDDSIFEDKFVFLGTKDKPISLVVLLSDNDEPHKGYSSIIGLRSDEITKFRDMKFWDMKTYESAELSDLYDSGEITEEIIQNSISRVDPHGLQAWREIAEATGIGESLKAAILGHERIKNND